MHSISKLPSRMHGCGLWRGAEQGPPSLSCVMLPVRIHDHRAALLWEISQQLTNWCQRQDRAAFQAVDLGWGSRFKVWAWELWFNNSLAIKRSPGSSWHTALFSNSCSDLGSCALWWCPCAAFSLLFVLCFVKCTAAISFADLCNSLRWMWIFGGMNPCILSQYFNVHLQITFYFRNIREYFGIDLNVAPK